MKDWLAKKEEDYRLKESVFQKQLQAKEDEIQKRLAEEKKKLQYDLFYVKNHSLFLDAIILFETIKIILFGRGAQ